MNGIKVSVAIMSLMVSGSVAQASDLGVSVEELLGMLETSAAADGVGLEIKKVACAENPMPGDESKKIISCSHGLGDSRVLITNADPSGPLLDLATQMWPEGNAAAAVSWIAGALNGNGASDHSAVAAKLVAEAKAANLSSGVIGKGEFFIMSSGPNFMISVSVP